jgi:inhibitor of KinA sporulation pathway (predicted exonuclease)
MNGIAVNEISHGEIIEIGAVLLDSDFNIIKEFSTYVNPDKLIVSKQVKRLTHITEEKLVKAPKIDEALLKLLAITDDLENTTLYTWSETDTNVILTETKVKNIHIDGLDKLCEDYVDIQLLFSEQVGIENRFNLTKALNLIGLKFKGEEHDALADAINTARLLREVSINQNVKKTIESISEYMDNKPLTSSLGSLFSKLDLDIQ